MTAKIKQTSQTPDNDSNESRSRKPNRVKALLRVSARISQGIRAFGIAFMHLTLTDR